jgi:SEC-C motif-containing protein
MSIELSNDCPCGSGQAFTECCNKYISQGQFPETPEQLMRSRYSAYTLKNKDYLLKSWHPSTRPDSLDLATDTTQWKKLKIISTNNIKGDYTVHFVAFFTDIINGKETDFYLIENSEFIKGDKWYYLKGIDLKTSELTKNMPCPCQSGKKFKRCCASAF